jgi:hypothetical protein
MSPGTITWQLRMHAATTASVHANHRRWARRLEILVGVGVAIEGQAKGRERDARNEAETV